MGYANREEVRAKIEWEVGYYGALVAGMTADEMPDKELHDAWAELERLREEARKVAVVLDNLLGRAST